MRKGRNVSRHDVRGRSPVVTFVWRTALEGICSIHQGVGLIIATLVSSSTSEIMKDSSNLNSLTLYQWQILDSSKLKEFADDNFKFDENGRKLFKWVKNSWKTKKLLVTSNISFSHSVFKRLVLQTHKNQG